MFLKEMMEEIVSENNLNEWYVKLLDIDYNSVVSVLKRSYGPVHRNYFTDSSCEFRTKEISRTKEGLCIHHIDEDKATGLSTQQFAVNSPWIYQLAERLVYCNLLEHLILHIKIYQYSENTTHENIWPGLYGAKKIMKQIDDFYCGKESMNWGEKSLLTEIIYLRDEYLFIVDYAHKIGIKYAPNTLQIPYHPPVQRYSADNERFRNDGLVVTLFITIFVISIILAIVFAS